MKLVPLITVTLAAVAADDQFLRKAIELKYGSPVCKFEIAPITPTTKALWFDWEKDWWGSFNVVEVDSTGKPAYWYDIRDWPSGQSIRSVRAIKLSGKDYVEVIDQTHMGNGFLYIYAPRSGTLDLLLKARVMANLGSLRFETKIANIEYKDSDSDGDDDVIVTAQWLNEDPSTGEKSGTYVREFHNGGRNFTENIENRRGPRELMD